MVESSMKSDRPILLPTEKALIENFRAPISQRTVRVVYTSLLTFNRTRHLIRLINYVIAGK